jgi:hypothetical protein
MASRYSDEEINKLKLIDAKKLLVEYVNELRQYDEILGEYDNDGEDTGNGPLKMMRLFIAGMEKMKALELKMNAYENESADAKSQKMEHVKIKETLGLQQSMVESLDRKNRETNVIITGVKEDQSLDGADNDEEKCKKILDKMGCSNDSALIKSVSRLGKADNKKRPILIVGSGIEWRNRLVEKSKELKTAGNQYKEIYVKKDVHPAVRREWWRLHTVKEEEEKRPENVGHQIKIDYIRRVVLKDDVIIDSWSPNNNFQPRGPR